MLMAANRTIVAAIAGTGPQPFTWGLSRLTAGLVQNGQSVKSAPVLEEWTLLFNGKDFSRNGNRSVQLRRST